MSAPVISTLTPPWSARNVETEGTSLLSVRERAELEGRIRAALERLSAPRPRPLVPSSGRARDAAGRYARRAGSAK